VKKRILAIGATVVVALLIAISVWFAQHQFVLLQNANSNLRVQINNLQDENRDFYFEAKSLENQNEELEEQLGDLTKQLALERDLNVEITTFSSEDRWSDYGPWLGVPRARNVFNVSVRNNDVVMIGGLKLIVEIFSDNKVVGLTFSWKIDLLNVGEERENNGETIVPIDFLSDLTYVITLKSGEIVLDEFRLPLTTIHLS